VSITWSQPASPTLSRDVVAELISRGPSRASGSCQVPRHPAGRDHWRPSGRHEAWVTPGVYIAKCRIPAEVLLVARRGSTPGSSLPWPLPRCCVSGGVSESTLPRRRAELVCEGTAGRRLLSGVLHIGAPAAVGRARRAQAGTFPSGRSPACCLVTAVSSAASHCCTWFSLVARRAPSAPRSVRGGCCPAASRSPARPALALFARNSQSRCGGRVTVATVPLLAGRRDADAVIVLPRDPRARDHLETPCAAPVLSSTPRTGRDARSARFDLSAPPLPRFLYANMTPRPLACGPLTVNRARRVPGGVVHHAAIPSRCRRRRTRAREVGGSADRDLGVTARSLERSHPMTSSRDVVTPSSSSRSGPRGCAGHAGAAHPFTAWSDLVDRRSPFRVSLNRTPSSSS